MRVKLLVRCIIRHASFAHLAVSIITYFLRMYSHFGLEKFIFSV